MSYLNIIFTIFFSIEAFVTLHQIVLICPEIYVCIVIRISYVQCIFVILIVDWLHYAYHKLMLRVRLVLLSNISYIFTIINSILMQSN